MTPSRRGAHRRIPTLIVGAGQAGLALSSCLTAAGHDHVVLERGRVGERWRSERWPSLRLLTPGWANRLPGARPSSDPHGFAPVGAFVAELEDYARSFGAPVREHESVRAVTRRPAGYRVATSRGVWDARQVVVATGDCDLPRVPSCASQVPASVPSLHAARYVAPDALRAGPVLVVGAGASGQQLALELVRAGRRVVLSAGRHARMVRRYRGRDAYWWLAEIGALDERIEDHPAPERALRASGFVLTGSGEELDLGVLQRAGVELTGRLLGFDGRHARFAGDLTTTVAESDARLAALLDRFDAHAAGTGLGAVLPPAHRPAPVRCGPGPAAVDLRGFGAVVWATGYRRAYPWLRVPVLGHDGELVHDRGSTAAPGLHVLGLRFLRRRDSHSIGGVGRDAAELAGTLTAARPARPCTARTLA